MTATATEDLKKWGHRTFWWSFNQLCSSLFFNRLINTIILKKYFHPKHYYSSTKPPLSDIHADSTFYPPQNTKIPLLPYWKLHHFHTAPAFHQRTSAIFFLSFFLICISDTLICSSSSLPSRSLCLTTWLVHFGVPLPFNYSCAIWIHSCQLSNE